MVSCFPESAAINNFVPTPSTLETRTGLLYLSTGKLKQPPKEPISDKVYLLKVLDTCFFILLRPSFATSISTPASLYVVIHWHLYIIHLFYL